MPTTIRTPDTVLRIKAATRDLIAAAGGLERAGEIAGVGKSTMHRWGEAGGPDIISLVAVLSLEHETGLSKVSAVMFNLSVGQPSGQMPQQSLNLHESLVTISKTYGDLTGAIGLAAQGTASVNELGKIDRCAAQMEDELASLRLMAATRQSGPAHLKEVVK